MPLDPFAPWHFTCGTWLYPITCGTPPQSARCAAPQICDRDVRAAAVNRHEHGKQRRRQHPAARGGIGTCHRLNLRAGISPMIGTARSPCLLPLQRDLRHHRAMDTEESGGKSPRLRVSAWLPPGLALAWLATLATLVRGVGMALAAWGATVSAVLLAVLLMHWLRRGSSADEADDGDPVAGNEDAAAGKTARASTRSATDPAEKALRPDPAKSSATDEKNPDSGPGLTAGTPVAPGSPVPELRVLTAEEAASVLRVDAELVKASISSGEFPGNRIGPYWRVDQEALTRWLQGTYRSGSNA